METNSNIKCTLLSKLCGMPLELARNSASAMRKYFEQFKPAKKVKKQMEMKDLVSCFDLPRKVGGAVLGSEERKTGVFPERISLKLKHDLSKSTLLDLGCALFLSVISKNVPDYDIKSAFQDCGIPANTLMSLLCRVFLNGSYSESNPCVLLQHLHRATTVIVASDSGSSDGETDLWLGVCLQCAQCSNVGHALLASLLYQKFATSTGDAEAGSPQPTDSEDSAETWETVSAERERWVRMAHHLEVLTLLSNVIGVGAMRTIPPVPSVVVEVEEEEEKGYVTNLNILDHQVQLLQNGDVGGVYAALLESTGPQLIAHCVAKWLVESQVPPDFVARLPSDPNDVQESDSAHSRMVFQLSPLLKLLPHTLSSSSLLTHCAWQALYQWRDNTQKNCQMCHQALQYISQISDIGLLQGLVGFLWSFVFESSIVRVLDSLKRGTSRDSATLELISVCRNFFGFLYQLSRSDPDSSRPEEGLSTLPHDVLIIPQPPSFRCLLDIVLSYPALSPTLSKTYFELLLLTEMALQLRATVNVAAFFPTWVRGALKKGMFGVGADTKHEVGNIPPQVRQKRAKFLREAVNTCLGSAGPKMSATISSAAITRYVAATSPTALPRLELVEFSDFIFLLAELWGLDVDDIRQHWVFSLFGAGLGEHGREAFLSIEDKSRVSRELLLLAGYLVDHLIHSLQSKTERLAVLAQVTPSLLEWLRKQSSSGVAKRCPKLAPTWTSLAQLVALIQPYLQEAPSATPIAQELNQIIQLKSGQETN